MGFEETDTDPERAFWLLSDETRVAILRSLWESSDDPISFTELRERTDIPDSGQFNYHLGKLREHFVSKTEDGYALTQAGREVVRAVLAGSITEQPHMDPTSIDGDCAECGASLTIRYDEYCVIECSECDETLMWNEFPPAGLAGRMPEETAMVFDEWTRNRFHLAMDGICPNCASEMSAEILEDLDEGDISTNHRCGNCRYEARVPLFGHVIRHPSVVSFYYDRGIDLTDIPYWELRRLTDEFDETVLEGDQWSASITIEADDEWIRLTLDDQFEVTDVESSDN